MPGRFPQTHLELILQLAGEEWSAGLAYNVAPGAILPLLKLDDSGFRLVPGRWGFVPGWSRTELPPVRPINAKAETVETNGLFRSAFRHGRTVTETDGFFEWQTVPGSRGKKPYWIRRRDRKNSLLAAISDIPRSDGEPIRTCALITTPANELVRPIHLRMPVLVRFEDVQQWMDPQTSGAILSSMMRPCPSRELEAVPISIAVSNPRNQGEEILHATGEALRVDSDA